MNAFKITACFFAASLLSVWAVGCSCHSDCGHGGHGSHKLDYGAEIPHGSLPDPPGAHVRRFQATQRNNAIAIEYAIFIHEWQDGGTVLGPYGEHHVQHIIKRLPSVPYPVLVQPTHDPAINEFRRNAIIARLLEGGIVDAQARVILRNPEAEGLFGDEAPRIFQKLLNGSSGGGGAGGGTGLPGTYLPGGGFGGFGGGFGGFGGFGGMGY